MYFFFASLSPFMTSAFVAQWTAHQTSNLGVAGSNPAEGFFAVKNFKNVS